MMHRCLAIPEMFDLILTYLQTKPTLASLARTGRTFHAIALDHLWMNLDEGLGPLLALFSVFEMRASDSYMWVSAKTSTGFRD